MRFGVMFAQFTTQHIAIIITALSGALFIVTATTLFLFIRYRQLSTTLAYLMRGAKAVSLEDIIITHGTSLEKIEQDISDIQMDATNLRTALAQCISNKGVVRYNPFKDLGGDQSFAVALLDSKKNGLVISSLHTREGTRVYAKPIAHGTSSYKLSDEEEHAIRKALEESEES